MNRFSKNTHNSDKDRGVGSGPETIDSLIADLGSKNARVRASARQSLVAIGEPAVIPLVEALTSQREGVRLEAAKALVKMNMPWSRHATPEMVELLLPDLASEDGVVRVTARLALVAIGGQAVSALVKALGSKDEWMRWEVAKALGQIGDDSAIEALVRALEDKMFDVRWLAAEALIGIGHKAIVSLLRELEKRPDSYWLREGAHHVFHDITDERLVKVLHPVLLALEDVEPSVEVPYATEKALESLAE